MKPSKAHLDTAQRIYDRLGRGSVADIDAIAQALAEDAVDSANLLSIIADIREESGLGAKPMLGDLADAIAARIDDARREGMKRAADIARCDCCDVCGESPGYPKCANDIADAILSTIPDEAE